MGTQPFALWKIGDQPLLYHWLDHMINEGYSRLVLYCSHHVVAIRKAMDHATLWPLKEWEIVVNDEAADFPGCEIADTLPEFGRPKLPGDDPWALVDHWFQIEQSWLERHQREDKELSLKTDGVGRWCQIHPSTVIHRPVWIGDHVKVGPNSEIGPYVTIGNGCVLSGQNKLAHSKVADHTFMGRHTELDQCYLEGSLLLNRKYRGQVSAVEPFIAGDLKNSRRRPRWRERISALWLWMRILKKFGLSSINGVSKERIENHDGQGFRYLKSDNLLISRAPQLLDVFRGRLFLYGVLPRRAEDLEKLSDSERRVISKASVGVFSLSDVQGVHSVDDPSESELALEHALSHRDEVRDKCRKLIRRLFSESKHSK